MKPAALETKKLKELASIEQNLDALLKAKGLSFDDPSPKVRRPEFRVLLTMQRINAKLALVMKAEGVEYQPSVESAAVSEDEPVEETPAELVEEAPQHSEPEAGAAEEAPKPAKSSKKK